MTFIDKTVQGVFYLLYSNYGRKFAQSQGHQVFLRQLFLYTHQSSQQALLESTSHEAD